MASPRLSTKKPHSIHDEEWLSNLTTKANLPKERNLGKIENFETRKFLDQSSQI